MLQIHRQKFDPTARYVLARPMAVGERTYAEGEELVFPTADVSTEVVRRMWKERMVIPAPVPVPEAPAAAAGAGGAPGGGPSRPAAPPQARRGR